jgi:hypothetical protein
MTDWEDVQTRKAEMQKKAIAALSSVDREILTKVLELEWDNRHLKTPDVRKTLRNFIHQACK